MLNKEQEDEECDATDDDSSTEAGIKIVFINGKINNRNRGIKHYRITQVSQDKLLLV
jgi:hypothetical protein